MPLRDDLLTPIAGQNPSGVNLRYDAVYDKIKEARRREDDLNQGIWAREVKKADYAQVIKLASDTLAQRSKDLQIAAWLTEAIAYEDGINGLKQAVRLLRGLIEQFWDTLYPELEDGDPFMRSGILDWVGSHLDDAIRNTALTRSGYTLYDYKDCRTVAYEADCGDDSEKLEARSAAIADGKMPPEQFDEDLNRTPKQFYVELKDEIEAVLEELRSLENLTDEKFTEEPPSFSGLRSSLEEAGQTVRMLLARKREQEPDEETAAAVETEAAAETEAAEYAPPPAAVARPAPKPKAGALSPEPSGRDDAMERVVTAARYLRENDAYSPVPYLVLRGLRWGELRAAGTLDPALLESPPSQIRQDLKRNAADGYWEEVLKTAETAMGMPCGRGWLDLQRYVVRACRELGSYYDPIAAGVIAEVRALLADFPELPDMTLMDDTPAANRETQEWLREIALPLPPAAAAGPDYAPEEMEPAPAPGAPPDAHDLAKEALASGRADEAMAILAREITQARSGRDRFHRRVQLAQICLASGKAAIAFPILGDVAAEIEKRRLEEWEAPEVLAHPLVLLYRCMKMLDRSGEERQRVYERICRLDPVQAMMCD